MGTPQACNARNDVITWRDAHDALSRLAKERAAADAEEGRWLLAAYRAATHIHLGYGAFSEYVERLFGYQPRSTQEKLRVAEALETLPACARALESGELNWSAVRELSRVAVPDTEHEWIELARGKTVRQLEQLLAGKRPADTPHSPPDPNSLRHILRFEVGPETFALVRDALQELRRRSNTTDDDSALLEMARAVLGGPRDEGRASYQIVRHECPECGAARQQTAGGLVPLDAAVTRMAHCDAQHVGTLSEPNTQPANDLEHIAAADPDAHVGVAAAANPPPPPVANQAVRALGRAAQSIPPALRRSVRLRAERQCQIPGCQNSTWLDVHHFELRSEGGRNSLDNLVCLCSTHHRAAHHGKLLLDRSTDGSLRVRHADGSDYGSGVNPRALDAFAKVFSALRNLGFREVEARTALEPLRRDPTLAQSPFDRLLREALGRLHSSRRRH